MYINARLSINR